MKILQYLFFTVLLIELIGCQNYEEKNKMEKPTIIEISLEESFELFKKKYPTVKVEHQPIGANFYEFRWKENKPATIVFNMEGKSFEFPYVISMLMMEVISEKEKGITSFSFKSGVTYDEKIPHDEARKQFYGFLRELVEKGWKRTISLSDPRLSNSQSMHYMREHESYYSTDISYLPTLKEWRALKKYPLGTYWELHADNKAFISIKLSHKDDKNNDSMGIYLLEITIKNDQEKGRDHFRPSEKENWNDPKKWKAMKLKLLKKRRETEKDLLSKGYDIDENYIDYDISPK